MKQLKRSFLLTHFLFSKASHHEEFLGSLAAEVTEGVKPLWGECQNSR
ncbi:MAG: hypothetical protein J6W97_05595 [Bacteroidaceae bacterium]|nr:hypothetical protein [Bacteroidaceae bacterium]